MKRGTRLLLEKAERAIRAAEVLLAATGAEFSAGRVYYAMFYTAEALLFERDLKFSKHGTVHAAFGREFAKSGLLDSKFHRWLLNAFDLRIREDYDAETFLSSEHVEDMLEQARIFLLAAQDFLREREADRAEPSS
jgi:uncharacterized protein (UPF0332 family)